MYVFKLRRLAMVLIPVLLIGILFIPPSVQAAPTIRIFIGGKELVPEVSPILVNNRTMVPLGAISEGLGMKVEWQPDGCRVVITTPGGMSSGGVVTDKQGSANQTIRIFIDGKELMPEVAPILINNRTMVPLGAISEGLGMKVEWKADTYRVIISKPDSSSGLSGSSAIDAGTPIMGQAVATSQELHSLLHKNNPNAPDLVDLYLSIGSQYGVRGDIAFCQAAKETGWWKFGGLVQPEQDNYCGLGATGSPATGEEDLHGADPGRVHYLAGQHGAYFDTPATGVEAQIQHLYAYATTSPLPAGKTIVDPRFTLVRKGIAPCWTNLNGRWAVPGDGYGESILNDYYAKALAIGKI